MPPMKGIAQQQQLFTNVRQIESDNLLLVQSIVILFQPVKINVEVFDR